MRHLRCRFLCPTALTTRLLQADVFGIVTLPPTPRIAASRANEVGWEVGMIGETGLHNDRWRERGFAKDSAAESLREICRRYSDLRVEDF